MKKLTYILLFCGFVAQSAVAKEAIELLENDPLFEEAVPDLSKYSEEWGVELASKRKNRIIQTSETQYLIQVAVRRKIVLNDKAAVNYFSNYQLPGGADFTMKIYKPNGRVITVDTADAIPVYEGFSFSSNRKRVDVKGVDHRKLAIRFLEVGDIVDYTYAIENTFASDANYIYKGEPIFYNTLMADIYEFGSDFTTLAEEFELETSNTLYISLRPMNNLPDFDSTATDSSIVYNFRVNNIEKTDDRYFVKGSLLNPRIDFAVYRIIRGREYRVPMIVGNSGQINTKSTYEKFKRALFVHTMPIGRIPKSNGRMGYAPFYFNYSIDNLEEFINFGYRRMQWDFCKYESRDYSYPSLAYAEEMYKALKSKGFEPEFVVCIPKDYDQVENALFIDELYFGVRVLNDGEYYYTFTFKKFSSADDWNYNMVGATAYAYQPAKKYHKFELVEIDMPDYKPNNNRSEITLDVKLDFEDLKTKISSDTKHFGELKTYYAERVLTDFEAVEDGEVEYDIEGKQLDRFKSFEQAMRQKVLEGWLSEDFEIQNYKNVEIVTTGMEMDNDVLEYKQDYVLSDVLHKAADGMFVLDIGRLITSQIALSEFDNKRQSDVYVDFVKKYEYIIDIKIPEGYKITNLDALKTMIQNEAGIFSVSIVHTKNGIQITTLKSYTTNYLPKEKWPEMVNFLNTAYQFSQQKVVFMPVE